MPVKRWIPLPGVQGHAASSTGLCQIPVGPRYHALMVSHDNKASTQTAGSFNELRLKLNGKTQRMHTYAELQALNILNGSGYGVQGDSAGARAEFCLWLAEPWRKNDNVQDALAWGTGDVSSMQLELDTTANQSDSLRIMALVDNSIVNIDGRDVQQPLGEIVKWNRTIIPAPGTTVDINFGAINNRDKYQLISFADASNYITSYKVIVDNFIVHEATKYELNSIMTGYGLTPVTTRLDVVFDLDDLINSYLPMVGRNGNRVQDFRIQLTCSTALTSCSTMYQTLGPAD